MQHWYSLRRNARWRSEQRTGFYSWTCRQESTALYAPKPLSDLNFAALCVREVTLPSRSKHRHADAPRAAPPRAARCLGSPCHWAAGCCSPAHKGVCWEEDSKAAEKMLLAEDRLGQVATVSPHTVVSLCFPLTGLRIKASTNSWQCLKRKFQLNMHIHISYRSLWWEYVDSLGQSESLGKTPHY